HAAASLDWRVGLATAGLFPRRSGLVVAAAARVTHAGTLVAAPAEQPLAPAIRRLYALVSMRVVACVVGARFAVTGVVVTLEICVARGAGGTGPGSRRSRRSGSTRGANRSR